MEGHCGPEQPLCSWFDLFNIRYPSGLQGQDLQAYHDLTKQLGHCEAIHLCRFDA